MTDVAPLLLPATEALLDGWSGPLASTEHNEAMVCVLGETHALCWWGGRRDVWLPCDWPARLDVAHPEVQQHLIAWWVLHTGYTTKVGGPRYQMVWRLLLGRGTRADQEWLMRVVTEATQ